MLKLYYSTDKQRYDSARYLHTVSSITAVVQNVAADRRAGAPSFKGTTFTYFEKKTHTVYFWVYSGTRFKIRANFYELFMYRLYYTTAKSRN